MKIKSMFIGAVILMVIAHVKYGRLFHQNLMECIHEDYPQAKNFREFLHLAFQDEMGNGSVSTPETDAAWEAEKASSSWQFPAPGGFDLDDNVLPWSKTPNMRDDVRQNIISAGMMGTFDDEGNFVPKDQGYTTVQSVLIYMFLLGFMMVSFNSALWPYIFTAAAMLPAVWFVGWFGYRLYFEFNMWLNIHIEKFIINTRRAK